MDSEFVGGIGRKLKLAAALAGALTAFATASHANHFYRAGYYPRAHPYPRFVAAGHHYGGGYRGYRYRAPMHYRAPHSVFSFGLSFGYPRYYAPPPVYVYGPPPVYMAPHPVNREPVYDDRVYDREEHRDSDRNDRDYDRNDRDYDREDDSSRSSDEIDVENEPPAGTYYHDRFCNRNFSTLDDYTEHLESKHHSQTIDIIDRDSGRRVRTLEFVDDYWQVQQ